MKKLDFLSNSPKTFIFQQSSNKTTFGGVLTIIYILIILIIAFVYIYNYVANDKYIISYINYEKNILSKNITELGLDKDPYYNPTFNFIFELVDVHYHSLSNNFLLLDLKTLNPLERGKTYQYNVSDVKIVVAYKCSDINCPLQPEDKEIYEDEFNGFGLYRAYQLYRYDFQNKEKPLSLDDIYSSNIFIMNPDIMTRFIDDWQITIIKEEKGMLDNFFGNKNDSFGGTFYRRYSYYSRNQFINLDDDKYSNFSGYYKILFTYNTQNTFRYYAEYSRKKVSVFSLIANICSLALTIYNGFRFGFNFFYSEKFSNYKVIDNILTSRRKSKKRLIENKFDKSFPLLSINEMKDLEIEEKEEEEIDKINQTNEIKENDESLPKYHIFSFIGNFFYCKCCKKNKIQANITLCNNIIEKYYSIENLIYNQLMLENLLQDYKWNNPDLKSIKNIELIYKLKQMIKTEGIRHNSNY